MNHKLYFLLLLLTAMLASDISVAQTNTEVFGQNRIQYRRFEWKYYDAEHFKIYHYDRAGRELARYVAEQAEQDVIAIERRLGGLFPERVNIILYNSFDDFQQTNMGLNADLQMRNDIPAGTVNLVGDKLIIYFTGKHADLKQQLRKGMAQIVMERMLFGENFREMVRNAVLLNLPGWVTEGYVDFVVDGWTTDDDNAWKNLMTVPGKVDFHMISERHPRLSGKAFWKYIDVKFGAHQVQNLLYLTQLKSSLNKAMRLTFHQKLQPTYDSLVSYYQNRYAFEEQIFEPIDTSSLLMRIPVPQDEGRITNVMVSPRGGDVAYLQWKHGEYSVVLERHHEVEGKLTKDKSSLLKGGIKDFNALQDPDYPLMAWSNTGFKLGIIHKNRDRIRIRVYNSVKGKIEDFRVPANRFDRITGFTFMEDDDMIVIAAVRRGQSDLFTYRLKGGRMTQITDDAWDDREPVFVSGGARKGIVFLSNRPEPYINIQPLPNELPAGPMNAFFYNSTTESYDLLQLTRNTKGTISQAIPYGSEYFAYLSDNNGVRNRFVVLFGRDVNNQDSAYSVPVTNFSRSILYHQYNPASGKVADVMQYGQSFNVLFHKLELPAPFGPAPVKKLLPLSFVDGVANKQRDQMGLKGVDVSGQHFDIATGDTYQTPFYTREKNKISDSGSVVPDAASESLAERLAVNSPADIQGDTLSSVQDRGVEIISSDPTAEEQAGKRILYVDSTFITIRSAPYRLSFKPDFFSVRLDNNLLFTRYQSYTGTAGQYNNPSMGGMITASLYDKLEDYRFTGGVRLPVNFSGLTYYVQFENFRRRVDWGLVLFRQEDRQSYNFETTGGQIITEPGKTINTILQGSVNYPLNKVQGFRLHLGVRQDQMLIKAQDQFGLILPNTYEYWAMSRAEFVHDDTRNPTFNIWNGLRYKLFAEYMYKVYNDNETYFLNNQEIISTGGFYNAGFDIRYYHKIYKNFIAAIRTAGAHAGGNQQILYFLGGVDNDINPKFSNALQPSGRNNYAFQSLATSLRGYDQNARNGNTYALMNAELRFPILGTLMKRPVQSSILKHLQAVAFLDVGSAWEGLLPTPENIQRNHTVTWPPGASPTVSVTVPNYVDQGLAVGYGMGLRTMLFGYFARVDAALNINRQFSWYLSLGTDF